MKNGWHKICGCDVYVENDCILRGTTSDGSKTTFPYKWNDKTRCYDNKQGVKVNTFRNSDKYTMR